MSEEHSSLVWKQLNRTHVYHLNDMASDCERQRKEQEDRMKGYQKYLIDKGIADPSKSSVYASDCVLEPTWSGTVDLKDTATDPSKLMTKPSIGWTCQPRECHIEGDLPVPLKNKEEMIKRLSSLDKCGVDITHYHDDPVSPEAHVHVVCKGIHPSDLAITVDNLVRMVLERRGFEVE